MKKMLPNRNGELELNSVEVTDPQESQTFHICNAATDDVSSTQTGSKVTAFLRRNAFVATTMVGVVLGKYHTHRMHKNDLYWFV